MSGAAGEKRSHLRSWWGRQSLMLAFMVYLVVYLVAATALARAAMNLCYGLQDLTRSRYLGGVSDESLYVGPYVYDPAADELVPASEVDVPNQNEAAVYVGTTAEFRADAPESSRDDDYVRIYATMDDVRAGRVLASDWGLNYDEGFYVYVETEQEASFFDSGGALRGDRLADYDAWSRARRVQSAELFFEETGVDLTAVFGEGAVSNVAYYVESNVASTPLLTALYVLTGMMPFAVYGGLAWVMFRRFYRANLEEPLASLGAAAERIAAQDLDFAIEPVRGGELGRLARTMEAMRAALLRAQRDLWATAEERRRLNAAFAHDLRTPVTVLKGTVEMARLRASRGLAVDDAALAPLSAQVERLERYVAAFSGVARLADRPVERERMGAGELLVRLRAHAQEVIRAKGPALELSCEVAASNEEQVVAVDAALVEEVMDNLLSNACDHAKGSVRVGIAVHGQKRSEAGYPVDGSRPEDGPAPALTLRVADDGAGFSSEALRRGCEPFYGEAKSAEHFGLGLNVASTLASLHGGSVELANGNGGGAVVTATFDVTARSTQSGAAEPDAPTLDAMFTKSLPLVDGA